MAQGNKEGSKERRTGKRRKHRSLRLEYCEYGLANNFGDYIEVNENLKKYPKLLGYVIKHERTHKKEFDLPHEFNINIFRVIQLIFFCIKYPKTLVDLIPIRKIKNTLYYDINSIILYAMLIISIILFVLMIKKF